MCWAINIKKKKNSSLPIIKNGHDNKRRNLPKY